MTYSDSMAQLVSETQRSGHWETLLEQIPYAGFIGLTAQTLGDEILFCMEPLESNTGNPLLPALHGGVIAGFMETAATLNLMVSLNVDQVPKVIDFTIDYLRSGKMKPTYATCILSRQGQRIANVQVNAWQKDRETPIATARVNFLMHDK
ncbi:uncharacterized domain 1-containing protein [Oceanospirillum linum]|nr:uncharacterized domain 1-containing protein [Oleiphilus messinensis]SMP31212.1 uncharacterized domain 1-containing protein [Oceanospirillum linum]